VMFALETVSRGLKSELVLFAPAVADGDLYRLVTSAFMHYGVTHLLFNMYALWVIGPPLEKSLGRLRFTALYALSALGGSVLVYLLSPLNAATAGASGAVFGLFGAAFVVGKRLSLDTRWVVGLIALNLAFTFVIPLLGGANISWQGHIGGLVTGAVVAAAYAYAPRERRTLIQISATVALLVLFTLLIWWRTTDLLAQFGIT
jgi:membrane associated rhomboid family serine protease